MASETDIVNVALVLVGAAPLSSSLDVNTSAPAKVCQVLYPRIRDMLNAQFRWNFSLTREVLGGADEDEPAFGYTYAYTLPADLLTLWQTDIPDGLDFKVENGRLLTDETDIGIVYTRRVTTVSSFTEGYRTALEYKLAADIAISVTREPKIRVMLMDDFKEVLHDALTKEAHENRPPITYSGELINVRYGAEGLAIPFATGFSE